MSSDLWAQRAMELHPCQDNTCREGVMLREGMQAAALHLLAHATDWTSCDPGSPCLECFSCVAAYFSAFSEQEIQADLAWFDRTYTWRTVPCPTCQSKIFLAEFDTVGKPVVCGACRATSILGHHLFPAEVP